MAGQPMNWRNWVVGLSLTALIAVAAIGLPVGLLWWPEHRMGRDQPIPFSHRLHATDKQIDCNYCHPYQERSLNAGLPTVETCLGCHRHIIPLHPEIVKLHGYEARGEEIPWTKVFYAPDHVYFPHYRHIPRILEYYADNGRPDEPLGAQWSPYTRAELAFYRDYDVEGRPCLECHGTVEAADRLRTHTYYMGFCLACHEELDASVECTACHQ